MKFARLLPLIAAALALHPLLARADDMQTVNTAVPGAGKVAVLIPPTWKQTVKMDMEKPSTTLKITNVDKTIVLQITFLADAEGRFATKEGLDAVVTKTGNHYLSGAVEKEITLTHYTSDAGKGCYTAFTDKDLVNVAKPPAGQFRKVLTGVFSFGKLAAVITLDSNETESPEYKQALQIVTGGISAP